MKSKQINKLLGSLDQAERNYLQECLNISRTIRELVRETGTTHEEIAYHFNLDSSDYAEGFINGDFNYDIRRMAILNAWWFEIEQEKLKGKVPVSVKDT